MLPVPVGAVKICEARIVVGEVQLESVGPIGVQWKGQATQEHDVGVAVEKRVRRLHVTLASGVELERLDLAAVRGAFGAVKTAHPDALESSVAEAERIISEMEVER